mmetsp:Transcript_8297/g.22042  ORF Transcript_8297/g.22042 Transcript_8297/m.22042 type:complete len:83 (-) Transcript_8297:280-528(-)
MESNRVKKEADVERRGKEKKERRGDTKNYGWETEGAHAFVRYSPRLLPYTQSRTLMTCSQDHTNVRSMRHTLWVARTSTALN